MIMRKRIKGRVQTAKTGKTGLVDVAVMADLELAQFMIDLADGRKKVSLYIFGRLLRQAAYRIRTLVAERDNLESGS